MAIELIGKASAFAIEAHGIQKYGRKPYHIHLLDVAQVLRRFFDWDELLQEYIDAAWLHDTIEDTGTTVEEIEAAFGERVAYLVLAVTNPSVDDKKLRDLLLYEQIKKAPGAINIKLADRIANVEQCISYGRVGRKPNKLFKRYAEKWPLFEATLRGHCAGEGYPAEAMWEHLDMIIGIGKATLGAHDVAARLLQDPRP